MKNFKHRLGILTHLCRIISWNVFFGFVLFELEILGTLQQTQISAFWFYISSLAVKAVELYAGQEAHSHTEYPLVSDSSWYLGEGQWQSRLLFIF